MERIIINKKRKLGELNADVIKYLDDNIIQGDTSNMMNGIEKKMDIICDKNANITKMQVKMDEKIDKIIKILENNQDEMKQIRYKLADLEKQINDLQTHAIHGSFSSEVNANMHDSMDTSAQNEICDQFQSFYIN